MGLRNLEILKRSYLKRGKKAKELSKNCEFGMVWYGLVWLERTCETSNVVFHMVWTQVRQLSILRIFQGGGAQSQPPPVTSSVKLDGGTSSSTHCAM